jgi:diaminobutyrate-2-oxoglutarate transaminase
MDFRDLSFVDAPLVNTTPPGAESQKYLDYQLSHESSAVSYPRGMPMAIRRARGATVQDVDGNWFIDFFGGAGVMNVGHSNPRVLEAVTNQVAELTHALDFPNPSREKLVKGLSALMPKPLTRLMFGGPTGSDAVESAVKLARTNTGRYPIIAFEGSYHGMTSGALALSSGRQFKEDFLPLVPEIHFVPYAYCYRCAFGKEPKTCDLECARYLDHVLDDPHSGVGMPAAVIVEPIQGEGGSIVPPDGFIPMVRESCDKHGVLMIADEVQAGFCRTGKMFSFEHTGTVPDIVTMSKALGGCGFPISGIAFKEALNTWPAGKHIGTFRGNVTAYAAGAAAIDFMTENNLSEHALNLGRVVLSHLEELEADSAIVGEARGKGLMLGVEIVEDKSTKVPSAELATNIRAACHRRGLMIEIGGHYNNVARFLPPLVLTEELAKRGVTIFAEAVKEVESTR